MVALWREMATLPLPPKWVRFSIFKYSQLAAEFNIKMGVDFKCKSNESTSVFLKSSVFSMQGSVSFYNEELQKVDLEMIATPFDLIPDHKSFSIVRTH